MSHLALLVGGGVLLFILFFVMVSGKKEGFRPPGPACTPASFVAGGADNNTKCTKTCKTAKSADGSEICNGGYYNATDDICECFMKN